MRVGVVIGDVESAAEDDEPFEAKRCTEMLSTCVAAAISAHEAYLNVGDHNEADQ